MGVRQAFQKALVTGGGGFLGRAIVAALLARGTRVRNFSRGSYPDLESQGVEMVQGDLADRDSIERAVSGCDVIFHVAARVDLFGDESNFRKTNVEGTRNVIAGCRKLGVKRLVFTSSPSVVFNGRDMNGVNESVPYAKRFLSPYPKTKAAAEMMVLASNDAELATVALRPHLIWGPGDPHLTSGILERARAGTLVKIGGESKLADFTFVEDAARAHILAAERLLPGSPIAGKSYFISQGEPIPIWDFVAKVLNAASLPPVSREIPVWLAYGTAALMEFSCLIRQGDPPFTRFLVKELSTSHWFDISAARRDLGYSPSLRMEEAFAKLRQALN